MKTRTRNAGLACVCLAAALASGCKEEPRLPDGHFVLALAGYTKVPVVLERDSSCKHVLMDGSVDMRKDKSFSSTFTIGKQCGAAKPRFQTTGVRDGRYQMNGDTAAMFDDAGRFSGIFWARGRDTLYARGTRWSLVYVRR